VRREAFEILSTPSNGMGTSVYTIGHSNHSMEAFLTLLEKHGIRLVIDIRSRPYSRHAPHFAMKSLSAQLSNAGIDYVFLGAELGGMPANDEFYDEQGYVCYDRIAASPGFLEGIHRVEAIIWETRAALVCAEEDPTGCHRRLLVGRVLAERGVIVKHVRGDGRIETDEDIAAAAAAKERRARSPRRGESDGSVWRSWKPVKDQGGTKRSRR